jgi:hypothetical protein
MPNKQVKQSATDVGAELHGGVVVRCKLRFRTAVWVLFFAFSFQPYVLADSFTATVFATGGSAYKSPDSITLGDGSVWVAYTNGACSTGCGGGSTVVQYSPSGAVLNTYPIAGSVDGLQFNPTTGMVWALQNQDGNSSLTIINPTTHALTPYSYAVTSPGMGYDDVQFLNGQTYLSQTNPVVGTDPTIVKLTNSSSPLTVSTVLTMGATGVNLATGKVTPTVQTDPDSLKVSPTGSLVLSSGADGTLTFVANPGTSSQSVSWIQVVDSSGAPASDIDDSLYATATSGIIYLTDTGANTVYAIDASGMTIGELFVNVDSEDAFGTLNLATGLFTTDLGGLVSPHGLAFQAATPEPSTFVLALGGTLLLLAGAYVRRRRPNRGRVKKHQTAAQL